MFIPSSSSFRLTDTGAVGALAAAPLICTDMVSVSDVSSRRVEVEVQLKTEEEMFSAFQGRGMSVNLTFDIPLGARRQDMYGGIVPGS